MRGLRSFILFYPKLVERTSLDRGVRGYGVCYLFEVFTFFNRRVFDLFSLKEFHRIHRDKHYCPALIYSHSLASTLF